MGFRQKIEINEGRLTFLFECETAKIVVEGIYEGGEVFIKNVNISGEVSLPLLEEVISSIYCLLPQGKDVSIYTAESSIED